MDIVAAVVFWAFTVLGAFFLGGTLISLTHWRHWFVRGWDFPRILIGAGLVVCAVVHLVFSSDAWYHWAFSGALLVAAAWQVYKIAPYTRLVSPSVERARDPSPDDTFRLVASNVLMENDRYAHWLEVIRGADPDVILVLEMDETWLEHIRELEEEYPHTELVPQDNYYGMGLFSRLPLSDTKVRYIIEDDVPSIHTCITLPGGSKFNLHGVHPRPPEPIRGTHSTQRDAEMVVMGREIEEEREERERQGKAPRPTVVTGDFNDVAWSRTTRLFVKLGRLLDPRQGRGMYNSFDANSYVMSYPVDHVFHSEEFTLVELRLLAHVGSDHYPVFVELCCEPVNRNEKDEADEADEAEADERIQEAKEEGFDVDEDPI